MSNRTLVMFLWLCCAISLPLIGVAQIDNQVITDLIQQAEQHGEVPVILRLRAEPVSFSNAGRASARVRQDEIREVQERVLRDLRRSKSSTPVKYFKYSPLLALPLDTAGLKAALQHPDVLTISPDQLNEPQLAESSPLIGASTAWNMGYEGDGQAIVIIDTGVEASHPFLGGRVVAEACFSTNNASASSLCPNGGIEQIGAGAAAPCTYNHRGCEHGTHVAGIAAGAGSSFSGVARSADIIAVQSFSWICRSGECRPTSYTSDISRALEWVLDLAQQGYEIASVNMSLGGDLRYTAPCENDSQRTVIQQLQELGIATIVSSGNDSWKDGIASPACIPEAISVGNTGDANVMLTGGEIVVDTVTFSSNVAYFLDLFAPGGWISSSIPGAVYGEKHGTSMAAPHVAGAFAVLRSKQPSASIQEMLGVLKDTGTLITDQRPGSTGVTKPRIQLDAALNALGGSGVASLAVSPSSGFSAEGPQGGPFSPARIDYTLENVGSATLAFQVSENLEWLSTNPSSGNLSPGQNTVVSVQLTSTATTLAPGRYEGVVSFLNTTNDVGSSSHAVNLTVNTATGPANDKFRDAIALGGSGTLTASTVGATKELGEPSHAGRSGGASVWWRWRSSEENGVIVIDTAGSDFDTILAVYTGNSLENLLEVASNDDAGGDLGVRSRVSFDVDAGQDYFIAVDGYAAASGEAQLNWVFDPIIAPPGGLSVSPTEAQTISGAAGGPYSPATWAYTLSNTGSESLSYSLAIESPFPVIATSTGGTLGPGATTQIDIWPFDVSGLGPGMHELGFRFNDTISRTAYLELTGSATPGNDDFADGFPVSGTSLNLVTDNTTATAEPGEPAHGNVPSSHSLWWRWTAPGSGTVVVDTFGSNFDTTLGIYQGTTLSGLEKIAGNDDAASTVQSQTVFQVTGGQLYHIAVDGFYDSVGEVYLNLTFGIPAPSHDNFASAQWLSGSSGQHNSRNVGATRETGEPPHAGYFSQTSVWYRWIPPLSGTATLNTLDSNFDTILAVYTGSSLSTLTEVISNDDIPMGDGYALAQSEVEFPARADTVYYIAVDGFSGDTGNIGLFFQVTESTTEEIFTSGFE